MDKQKRIEQEKEKLYHTLLSLYTLKYGNKENFDKVNDKVLKATYKALEELDQKEYETVEDFCDKCQGFKANFCENCELNKYKK